MKELSREERYQKAVHHINVLDTARETAKEFGMSFVVFIGGLASAVYYDDGAARNRAREEAKKHGRDNVRIRPLPADRL